MRRFLLTALLAAAGCSSDNATNTSGDDPARLDVSLKTISLDAVGATRNDTAIALDDRGALLADAPIVWTTNSSAVTLAMPTVVGGVALRASATGPITGPAVVIVAAAPGTAVVTARSGDVSTNVTVTVAQAPAQIVVVSGDQQTARAGSAVSTPVSVKVLDRLGNPIAGATVTFAVTAGGGSLTGAARTTNASGIATLGSWTLGPSAGTNTITATVNGLVQSVTISATALPATGFSIAVRFLTPMSASQQSAFTAAAARWSAIVAADLPDVPISIAAGQCGENSPALTQTVDDLLIFATIDSIDGPGKVLGSAGPCYVRGSGGLTIMGAMTFDKDDVARLESTNGFTNVVLHEMGHVLGIGVFWTDLGLQNQTTLGSPPQDTYFPGANSIAGFNAIGGNTYSTGQKVPVENTGGAGTINAHWRESVLANELMTGFLNAGSNPLSILTVRSLEDLGYTVNLGAADPFMLAASIMDWTQPVTFHLQDDIRRGPIYSVDARGSIRRIR